MFITQRSYPCFSVRLEKVDSDSQEIVWGASEQKEGETMLNHPKPGLYKYCLAVGHETVREDVFVGFALRTVGVETLEPLKRASEPGADKRIENDGESPTRYYQVSTYLNILLRFLFLLASWLFSS